MANTKSFTKSFSGGEISAAMFGRIDDAKYQSGAALLRNFIATPQGPAQNRPGFAYVLATKNNGVARLISFVYSSTQTMVIELGEQYLRFHTQGETLEYSATQPAFKTSGTVTYTVADPTVITMAAHPFVSGESVVLAITGVAPTGSHVSYPSGLGYGPYSVQVIDANTFQLLDPATGDPAAVTAVPLHGGLAVQPNYALGDLVTFGGVVYYRSTLPPSTIPIVSSGLDTNPSTDAYWYALSSDLIYEIPSPYVASDLFDIHYVQSADVMTLVHPNYPPMELRRLGATNWTLAPISFGAVVDTPTGVVATASPGYLSRIASITLANPALITTVSSHTLALGDGIYITGLIATIGGVPTDLSGFYLVNLVPTDPTTGNLIPNQLQVMDYDGNMLDSSGWSSYTLSPGTIQYGTKIYDINSYYAVAAIAADGTSQSVLSDEASALDNLNVPGSFNVITWAPVTNASRYYVFKKKNGLWGYIGEAVGTTFTDNNIAPDFSITPVNLENPFSGANNYPAAVGYIEQRRCFAGTNNAPQTLWMTNSGTESTFAYSLPSQDTDRISIKVAAREVSSIEHIVPLSQLVLLTGSCEYAEYTSSNGPITPNSIGIRPQSYIGASTVQPSIINNSLVYCAARGGHVRELGYSWQSNGFVTGDLSLRSANLFDLLTIVDQAFSKAPLPIVWFVSSNGDLLGLTYVPEQQIGAWHHHDTAGTFESIACVAEGSEERLYAVIRRTINGQTVRYVERMASRLVGILDDCFFVDAGATYSGAPATTISGLDWLEGATVAVLADGAVQNQKVVMDGAITLDHPASTVQVGLPYTSDLQTLPPALQVDGYGQGRQLNVNKLWIRLYQSSGIFAGPSEDLLTEYKQRTTEVYGAPPALQSGQAEITLTPSWNDNGQILVRQENPLPLTVVAITMEMAIGG